MIASAKMQVDGYDFEIVDMDRNRVDKILVKKSNNSAEEENTES